MKTIIRSMIAISLFSALFISCKKEDEGEELDIRFKTGTGYTSADATVESGADVKIGVEAETEKEKDPIIRFTISESVNSATSNTVFTKDMSTAKYSYDYSFNMEDTVSGNKHKYIFNITNKDGRNAQKSLTLTVQ